MGPTERLKSELNAFPSAVSTVDMWVPMSPRRPNQVQSLK